MQIAKRCAQRARVGKPVGGSGHLGIYQEIWSDAVPGSLGAKVAGRQPWKASAVPGRLLDNVLE